MYVATCRITLHLPGNHSLKGKRGVLRSLTGRIRKRFNVSVAEVGDTEKWQAAELGLSCVSSSSRYAGELLAEAVRFIEGETLGEAEVVGCETELLEGPQGR